MTEIFDEHAATNFYFDRGFNTEAVKLLPGEYDAGNRAWFVRGRLYS